MFAPYGDGVDVEVNTTPRYDILLTHEAAANNVTADKLDELFSGKAYLTCAHSDQLADMTDPLWVVKCASTCFPNGTGGMAKGIGLQAYCAAIQRQYPPTPARNSKLSSIMADRLTLAEVNRVTAIKLRGDAELIERLGTVRAEHLEEFHETLRSRARRPDMSDEVKTMHRMLKYCGNTVPSTPAFLNTFRCKTYALWDNYGAPSLFFTVNPGELNVQLFCVLSGKPYTFDTNGHPVNRPSAVEMWGLLGRNPVAADQFFRAFMTAFVEVIFGWDTVAGKQRPGAEETCLLGDVLAWYYNVETSTRMSEHAHGQVKRAWRWQHA